VLTLLLTTALISTNWLIYIWSVVTDRIIRASLGYYINPLVTVLLGVIFLDERLNRAQALSIALAALGVGILIWSQGGLPWIALALAFCFGFYSLLRKQVQAEAAVGLGIETALLSPLLLVYLLRTETLGEGAFGHLGPATDVLLAASGLVTALPLLLFTYGARRLPLTTIGFLQYSAPTLQFLLAVFLYREPFTFIHLIAFLFVWTALLLFSWDLRVRWRQVRAPSSLPKLD
jgi:chloramphenicol-sensitive protein RarD